MWSRRRRLGVTGLAALGLTATVVVAPAGVATAATTDVLGSVTFSDGSVAANTLVQLTHFTDTEAGTTEVLSSVVTGSDGRFALPLPQTANLLAEAAANGGHLNLEVEALNLQPKSDSAPQPTQEATPEAVASPVPTTTYTDPISDDVRALDPGVFATPFPVKPAENSTATSSSDSTSADAADTTTPLDRSEDEYTPTESLSETDVASTALFGVVADVSIDGKVLELQNPVQIELAGATGEVQVAKDHPIAYGDCFATNVPIQSADPWDVVGEAHYYWNVTGYFEYGNNADSELGIGVKEDGKAWKISGSVHVGKTSSGSSGGAVSLDRGPYWGKQIQTNFHYIKYEKDWYCDGYYVATEYQIRADHWNGGSQILNDESQWDGYAAYVDAVQKHHALPFVPSSTFDTTTEKSYTYTREISVMGVGLNARSGYSNHVHVHWHFGSKKGAHYLFGQDAMPAQAKIVDSY